MNYTQYPYLKDSLFLKEVDEMQNKKQVIKITVLDLQEKPIQSIEGRVTGGNLNINASSAIRRTGSLSLVADEDKNDLTNINSLFYLNKKVKLETGFKNTTNKYLEYETLWFPLGIYLMSNPNLSSGTSGTTISLNLKDKMCQLNGEMGGIIPSTIVFDVDANKNKIPFYQIIQELVHHWGGEQLAKIIIDVPEMGTSIIKENGIPIAQRLEPLYYTKELISNPGDSVVSILDKLKSELGAFEYFYDLEGNFIFREIRNYINTSYSSALEETIDLDKNNFIIDQTKGRNIYNFTDSALITSYSNSPQQDNIKNEFIIWGTRGENKYPIRYRLAIDKKPVCQTHDDIHFYQLPSRDYVEAAAAIINEKPEIGASYLLYLEDGQHYIWKEGNYHEVNYMGRGDTPVDWRTELYYQDIKSAVAGLATSAYAEDLRVEWPRIYDLINHSFRTDPINFDFFLDFIDTSSHIANMGANIIGRKTKVESSENVECIFYYDIANLPYWAFTLEELNEAEKRGYQVENYIGQEEILTNYSISGSTNDAYTRARELLYTHTQWGNAISVAGIPIYYLEPNHRITVNDNVSGIHGDYLINSISLPLDISGTMTLSCSKVLEKL